MDYLSKPLEPKALGTLDTITEIAKRERFQVALAGGAGCALLNAEAELNSQEKERELSLEEKKAIIETINDGSRQSDFDLYIDISAEGLITYLQKYSGRGTKKDRSPKGYTEFVYDNLKFQVTQVESENFELSGSRIVKIPKDKYKTYDISVAHPGFIAVFKLQRDEKIDTDDIMQMHLRGSLIREDIEYALNERKVKENKANLVLERYGEIVKRSGKE